MSEQQFEDFLKRHARDYNAPPAETPRDAMWTAIAEARAQRRPQAGAAGTAQDTGSGITSLDSRRPLRRYAPWIGMAATLLLGIGIGRFYMTAPQPSTVAQSDRTPGPALPTSPTTDDANDSAAAVTNEDAQAPRAPLAAPLTQLAATGSARLPAATRAEPRRESFSLASREHLQRAEALVSVVAATPADATMDSLTGKWAREMLTNTRLLLDSPAGDDPLRRRLLEDLETVLVQLVQRSGAATEERALLDRTLERTQLLTRLRTGAAGI